VTAVRLNSSKYKSASVVFHLICSACSKINGTKITQEDGSRKANKIEFVITEITFCYMYIYTHTCFDVDALKKNVF
jgi:hypothetical protein